MHDSLGDRMKSRYEDRTRYLLPRRTYTIIRCDGKAFHTFTRGCVRPYDHTPRVCNGAGNETTVHQRTRCPVWLYSV